VWGEWGEWSDCSQDCNTGTRVRYRSKAHYETLGGACPELTGNASDCSEYSLIKAAGGACTSRDIEPCNGGTDSAPSGTAGTYAELYSDGSMVPLFPYPACAVEDSKGGCTGYRPCPVDCVWEAWSSWSECSAECGQNGVQYRTRSVATEPAPTFYYKSGAKDRSDATACQVSTVNRTNSASGTEGYPCGVPCYGDSVEYRPCFRKECPVDCVWSEWSSWTSCSKLCGGGTQLRTRYVKEQPQHGGELCVPGPCDDSPDGAATCGSTHTRVCNPASCDFARIHDKQDDASKDQDLCQFNTDGSVHCPITITRDGGHLTKVGGNPRVEDPIQESCLDQPGLDTENCAEFGPGGSQQATAPPESGAQAPSPAPGPGPSPGPAPAPGPSQGPTGGSPSPSPAPSQGPTGGSPSPSPAPSQGPQP